MAKWEMDTSDEAAMRALDMSSEIVARQISIDIRNEQNEDYARSLQVDRAKSEQARIEAAKREEAEREAAGQRQAEETRLAKKEADRLALEQRRRRQADQLSPPGPDATSDLCIRLPTGHRIQRKFSAGSTLADVYAWADCLQYLPGNDGKGLSVPQRFTLSTSFPARELVEMGATIQELQLSGYILLLSQTDDLSKADSLFVTLFKLYLGLWCYHK